MGNYSEDKYFGAYAEVQFRRLMKRLDWVETNRYDTSVSYGGPAGGIQIIHDFDNRPVFFFATPCGRLSGSLNQYLTGDIEHTPSQLTLRAATTLWTISEQDKSKIRRIVDAQQRTGPKYFDISVTHETYAQYISNPLVSIFLRDPEGMNLEVKNDRKTVSTGNYFLETAIDGEPTGIYGPEYDNCPWWIYFTSNSNGDFHSVIGMPRELLRALGEGISKGQPVLSASGGDGDRAEGRLIPFFNVFHFFRHYGFMKVPA